MPMEKKLSITENDVVHSIAQGDLSIFKILAQIDRYIRDAEPTNGAADATYCENLYSLTTGRGVQYHPGPTIRRRSIRVANGLKDVAISIDNAAREAEG